MAPVNLKCLTLGQLDPQLEKKAVKSAGSDFVSACVTDAATLGPCKSATASQLFPPPFRLDDPFFLLSFPSFLPLFFLLAHTKVEEGRQPAKQGMACQGRRHCAAGLG